MPDNNLEKTSSAFLTFVLMLTLAGCTSGSENTSEASASSATQQQAPEEHSESFTKDVHPETSDSPASFQAEPPAELFAFKKNGKFGYVNAKGAWVIQPKYDWAFPFSDGLALVTLGKKKMLIDAADRPVPMPEGVTDISTFKGAIAPVAINGQTRFINRSGKIVTETSFEFPPDDMALPSEGMRMVVVDSLFTFLDSTGRIIREPGFDYALDFFEGLALVSNKGKYGYMDKSGRTAIPMVYDAGWSFSEGMALVGTIQGKDIHLSFIDRKGNTVIAVPYKMVNPRFTNGLTYFGIEKDGKRKFGFMNKQGKTVIEPVYDHAEEFVSSASRGFGQVVAFRVQNDGQWGLVAGEVVIKPAFAKISPFYEGLAAAAQGNDQLKFGYIDAKGKWAVQPQFDEASDFSQGLAAVRKGPLIGGKWGYIDAKGKIVIDFQFRHAYDFLGDIAIVQHEEGKALIDKTGKILIEE